MRNGGMRPDFACFKMVNFENRQYVGEFVGFVLFGLPRYRFCPVVFRIARIRTGPYPIGLPLASIPPKTT